MSEGPAPEKKARNVRWWPAGLILAAAAVAAVRLALVNQPSQQEFNIQVVQIVLGAALLLFLWLMFFSRLRWRTRLGFLGFVVLFVSGMAAMFRFHGVNGNLVPILEPRWTRRSVELPKAEVKNATLNIPSDASDFPQFLGPTRDGHLPGPKLATNWNDQPPRELWRMPVGAGWSGFAVAGGIAITQEQLGDDECVVARDLQTGKTLWSHADKRHFENALAGEGPRATPTIAGERVLVHGATGLLTCLNLVDGRVMWSRDASNAAPDSIPTWGEATSPLVENGLVVVNTGGPVKTSLAAFNLTDGALAWTCAAESGGYSSPMAATFDGVKQIIIFAGSLIGCDASTGNQLWQFSWPGGHPHVASPVLADGRDVIISSGYGTGSARIRIEHHPSGQWSATQVWRSIRMKSKFADLILFRDYIYGLDDGIMECIDAQSGALAWKDGRYGHGQILLVDDLLLVMAESGEVILVDTKPDALHELARFTALREKTWNPPALAGVYFLARNDKEAACFKLPIRR